MKESKQRKKGGSSRQSSFIQRMSQPAAARGEETPFVSRKPQLGVQPKLSVSQPGDPLEREADRVADQVMRKPQPGEETPMISRMHMGSSPVARKAVPGEKKEDGPASSETIVQRRAGCSDDIQTKKSVDEPPVASRQLAGRLQGRKGMGAPLPAGIRTTMEGRFGRDFSDVRVHTDEEAVGMCRELNAQAFTYGTDIYFNAGEYEPGTEAGQRLLAHELTHTVQQQGGAIKRTARRSSRGQANEIDINDLEKVEEALAQEKTENRISEGYISVENNSEGEKEIHFYLTNLKLKEYLWQEDIEWATFPITVPKPGRRRTAQKKLWDDKVRTKVDSQLQELIKVAFKYPDADFDRDKFTLGLEEGRGTSTLFIGTYVQILEKVLVPFWDINGKPRSYEIEHMIDHQLMGGNADNIKNLILLEETYNNDLGSAIQSSFNTSLKAVIKHYRDNKKFTFYKELGRIRNDFPVKIESFDTENHDPAELDDEQWYSYRDIMYKTYKGNPYKKGLIKIEIVQPEAISKDQFVLITSNEQKQGVFTKAGVVLPKDTGRKGLDIGAFNIKTKLEKEDEDGNQKVKSITFTHKIKDREKGLTTDKEMSGVEAPCELVSDSQNAIIKGNTYKVTGNFNRKLAATLTEFVTGVKGMSPIEITGEPTFDGFDFSVSGKVIPTISIFNGIDIDFSYRNGNYRIEANVPLNKIAANFPKPFQVHACYLTISAGSDEPLSVSGLIGFRLPKIGEGEMEASVTRDGVEFNGDFIFEGNFFDKPSVSFTYKKGAYSFEAELKVGRNKIKGLKSASVEISYDNQQGLAVAGEAVIGLHGGKEIVMALGFNEEGITISGEVDLSQFFPKGLVEKGKLDLSFTKDSEGYSLSGTGSITPRIPGVKNNPTLTISYQSGALTVSGKGHFEIWKGGRLVARGTGIEIGVTNQPQEGGDDPEEKAGDAWRFFGGGDIELFLGDNVSGKVSVRLDAKTGRPIISGTAELVPSAGQEDEEKGKKELFSKKIDWDFSFPLLTLPIGRISVFIEWWLRTYADLYLPQLQKISLSAKDFDLTKIGDTEAPPTEGETVSPGVLKANVEFLTKAKAGIEVGASIGIKGELLYIVEAVAKISGGVSLEGELTGPLTTGVTWIPGSGLTFDGLTVGLTGSAYFMASLEGNFRVYLDLWLTEIDILNEDLPIGDPVKFGVEKELSLDLTGTMGEDNLPRFDQVDKSALKGVPDLSSNNAKGDLLKQAAGSKNDEFKDPEPPSLEKAISVVRDLPSGPIIRSLMKKLDRGKEASDINKEIEEHNRRVEAFGSVSWGGLEKKSRLSRDTYLDWLSTRFPTLDWLPVYEESMKKDRREIAYFKRMTGYDQFDPASDRYQTGVLQLARDYPILFLWHPEEIDASGIYHGLSGFGGPEGYVSAQILDPAQNAEVKFLSVEVELDRYNGFQKGMWIHVSLETANLKEQLCELAAYFYYWNGSDWAVLRDYDDNYSTVDNQASVGKEFTPAYTNSRFPRITLFMPYKELHLAEGRFDLRFKLGVYPKKKNIFGNFLQYSSFYSFALVSG